MNFNIEVEKRSIIGYTMGLTPDEILIDICKSVKTKVSPEYIYIASRLPYSYISSIGIDNISKIYQDGKDLGLNEQQIFNRINDVNEKISNEKYRDKMNAIISTAYAEKKKIELDKPNLEDNSGLVH